MEIVLSYAVSKFGDVYRFDLVNRWLKSHLHGDIGYQFMNSQALSCMKYLITNEFNLPCDLLLNALSRTKSCICGGLALLAAIFRNRSFDGKSVIYIYVPSPTSEQLTDIGFYSAADKLINFLTNHNYHLNGISHFDPLAVDDTGEQQYGQFCGAYILEIFNFESVDMNGDGILNISSLLFCEIMIV